MMVSGLASLLLLTLTGLMLACFHCCRLPRGRVFRDIRRKPCKPVGIVYAVNLKQYAWLHTNRIKSNQIVNLWHKNTNTNERSKTKKSCANNTQRQQRAALAGALNRKKWKLIQKQWLFIKVELTAFTKKSKRIYLHTFSYLIFIDHYYLCIHSLWLYRRYRVDYGQILHNKIDKNCLVCVQRLYVI